MEYNIQVFKLTTGEEVIGILEEVKDGVFVVKLPLGIGIDQQAGRLVFVPYMPYTTAEKEVHFHASALVQQPVTPVESIANDFREVHKETLGPQIFVPGKNVIRPIR